LFPGVSHPRLILLCSKGRVFLPHVGGELPRLEKTRLVSEHPIALETLRVCWENPDSLYNCGKCKKCLVTMDQLQRCGALERCGTFPQIPRIKAVFASLGGVLTEWDLISAG